MAIRTEQTLRRMWTESLGLFQAATASYTDADQCAIAATEHKRAANAEAAAAASAFAAEKAKRAVGEGMEDEASDLADLVNRERQDAGLSLLAPGDPYPADPPAPQDTLLVSHQSTVATSTDGQLGGRVVGEQ